MALTNEEALVAAAAADVWPKMRGYAWHYQGLK